MPSPKDPVKREIWINKLRTVNLGKTAPNKGLSNVDFYGERKADEMNTNLHKNSPGGRNRKGKSDIEFYGEEKAKEIQQRAGRVITEVKLQYWEDKKDRDGRQDHRYEIWNKAVKERDNYTCRICYKENPKRIQAHHIKGWNEFFELRYVIENGLTLCQPCHGKLHAAARKAELQVPMNSIMDYLKSFIVKNAKDAEFITNIHKLNEKISKVKNLFFEKKYV